MSIVIEKATEEDIQRLSELYYDLTGNLSNIKKMNLEFDKFINNKDYYLLVIKVDDYIIGTGVGIIFRSLASKCRPFFVIDNVIIDKRYQNQGYGTLLFKKFHEYIIAKNCCFSYLITEADNYQAHKFYKKMGYNDKIIGFQKTFDDMSKI